RTAGRSDQDSLARSRRPSAQLPFAALDGGDELRERVDGAVQGQEPLQHRGEQEQPAAGEAVGVELHRRLHALAEGARHRPAAPEQRAPAAAPRARPTTGRLRTPTMPSISLRVSGESAKSYSLSSSRRAVARSSFSTSDRWLSDRCEISRQSVPRRIAGRKVRV